MGVYNIHIYVTKMIGYSNTYYINLEIPEIKVVNYISSGAYKAQTLNKHYLFIRNYNICFLIKWIIDVILNCMAFFILYSKISGVFF